MAVRFGTDSLPVLKWALHKKETMKKLIILVLFLSLICFQAHGMLAGRMMMGTAGAGVTWDNWNEASEASLASTDIFVCLFEDPDAGDDETGQGGGLSGVDLVLTQVGTVAGATGSPPTRVLDGNDDHFLETTAAIDALIANANKTWTIIIKVTNMALGAADYVFGLEGAGSAEALRCFVNAADNKIYFIPYQDGVGDSRVTTDAAPTATTLYFAMWADGTVMRAGFTTTRPTKWSDFDAGKRIEFATNTGDYSGETFNVANAIFADNTGGADADLDAYYLVMAKTCLIDNGS